MKSLSPDTWYAPYGTSLRMSDLGYSNQNQSRINISMNSLDAADIDRDGDIDLVTGEHKGPAQKVEIWQNDGKGQFKAHLVDQGKESHLGTRLFDLDNDGDLDIISIAWDEAENVHVWRNDAVIEKKTQQ